MGIRSNGAESTDQECANRDSGFLVQGSFPLFRPIEVCTASREEETRSGDREGDVAQLGEHLLCTQGVTGSSPVISTRTLSTE